MPGSEAGGRLQYRGVNAVASFEARVVIVLRASTSHGSLCREVLHSCVRSGEEQGDLPCVRPPHVEGWAAVRVAHTDDLSVATLVAHDRATDDQAVSATRAHKPTQVWESSDGRCVPVPAMLFSSPKYLAPPFSAEVGRPSWGRPSQKGTVRHSPPGRPAGQGEECRHAGLREGGGPCSTAPSSR